MTASGLEGKKASPESDWAITANRYVAYFDIMGFKDMVLRISHDEVYKMMKKIDENIKEKASINWKGQTSKIIKTTNYSDSIIIYSKDDTKISLSSFICTVSAFTNDLLTEGIPHRGAVAFGKMTLDDVNSIFFGQPLIDAYLLQEELEFYGVIAHATIENEIEEKHKTDKIPFMRNYLCNLKKGNSLHLTIIPAFLIVASPKAQIFSEDLLASCRKMRLKTSGHLRKYIDNTELYLKTIKENG